MQGRKPVVVLAVLALAAFFLLGMKGEAQAKQLAEYRWKFGTLAPKGVGWARHIDEVVLPVVKEATDGNLVIKNYWGGVMGDEEDYIRKMHIGQLQGAGMSGQGAVLVCPEMAVVELPFMFRNYEEVDFIKSKMKQTFDDIMRENGYFLLAWVDQDFDIIFSNTYPMNELANFKKAKFLTWYGRLEEELLRMLGADPIPVNVPEVATSIRQGVADTSIGPSLFVVGAQLYTSVKYVTPIKIRYSPSVIVITNETWMALPENYRTKFYGLRDDLMTRFTNLVRKDNEDAFSAMVQYGIQKVEVTPDQLKAIHDKSVPLWDKLADDMYPRELLDEQLAYLAAFRGEKPLKAAATYAAQAAPKAPEPAPAPAATPASTTAPAGGASAPPWSGR